MVGSGHEGTPSRTGTRRFGAAVLLLLAVFVLLAAVVSLALRHPLRDHIQVGEEGGRTPGYLAKAPTNVDPASERVTVGMYALDAYDIDPAASTFYMSGYMWLRWKGDLDPTQSLEFVNAVEDWGMTQKPSASKPQVLPTGEKVQNLRFQGRFYEPMNLSQFPLDSQTLNVLIESSEYPANQMVFIPDAADSGIDSEFTVPGWDVVNSVSTRPLMHKFGTSFGYPAESGADSYSAALFTIKLNRAPSLVIWKVLLPLLLVLVTAWLALIVSPKYPEIRIGMPATALLTAVFLQETAQVPWASNPVTLDRIYVVAFASIVVTLAMVIWDELHIRGSDDGDVAVLRVEKHDLYAFVINVVVTMSVIGLLIYSAVTSSLLA